MQPTNIYFRLHELNFVRAALKYALTGETALYCRFEPYFLALLPILTRFIDRVSFLQIVTSAFDDLKKSKEVAPNKREFVEIEYITSDYVQTRPNLLETYDGKVEYKSLYYKKLEIKYLKEIIIRWTQCEHLLKSNHLKMIFGASKSDIEILNILNLNQEIKRRIQNESFFMSCYKFIAHYLNIFSCLAMSFVTLIRKSRLSVKKSSFQMGYDFPMNSYAPGNLNFKHPASLIDSPKDLLVLTRTQLNNEELDKFQKGLPDHNFSSYPLGKTTFFKSIALAFNQVGFLIELLKGTKKSNPFIIQRALKDVVRRTQALIFHHQYEFKYFWCRDEYESFHIIRNKLLKDMKVTTFANLHGLPIAGVTSIWKYIFADYLIVTGNHIASLIAPYTNKDCHIIANGSFNINIMNFTEESRTNDIVYFQSPMSNAGEEALTEVFKVAKHFSDRIIYFKPKPGDQKILEFMEELNSFEDRPKNIEVIIDNSNISSFNIMKKCQYAITTGSTITAESIQAGLRPFVLDLDPDMNKFYYREFPGLCVKSASEIIEGILNIEKDGNLNLVRFENLINLGSSSNLIDNVLAFHSNPSTDTSHQAQDHREKT